MSGTTSVSISRPRRYTRPHHRIIPMTPERAAPIRLSALTQLTWYLLLDGVINLFDLTQKDDAG